MAIRRTLHASRNLRTDIFGELGSLSADGLPAQRAPAKQRVAPLKTGLFQSVDRSCVPCCTENPRLFSLLLHPFCNQGDGLPIITTAALSLWRPAIKKQDGVGRRRIDLGI